MGGESRREYLIAIRQRYLIASKQEKGLILREFCEVCKYHRKHAIRALNQQKSRPTKRAGRKPIYCSPEFMAALKRIWLATDQICSKKLVATIPLWLPFYERTYRKLSAKTKGQLLSVSSATIDRLLAKTRAKLSPKGFCATKPGRLLRNQIPIRTHSWDITVPGFMEADTVAHCGNSLAGDFIWSLTLTDIHTGWTEARATWNNGAAGVIEQVKNIQANLPFELKGFDCDNGGEFINHHLFNYFNEHKPKINFTRSRPYKKNDNAHVEQKNWTYVRQLLGYDRLENPILVELINNLYTNNWSLLQNYFIPSFKLLEKKRINSKYIRTYDSPKTAFERVIRSKQVSKQSKDNLKKQYQSLDPFKLKRQIEKQLKEIFRMVTVTSNVRKRI